MLFLDHYCLGFQDGRYLRLDHECEDGQPPVIVFESRQIAGEFRKKYADGLDIIELCPVCLFNNELSSSEHLYLCIDVRDGDAQLLQLSWWEFLNRTQHYSVLSEQPELIVPDRVEMPESEA